MGLAQSEFEIKELKKQKITHNKVQLLDILDGNPIATFVIDKDHKTIFWNRACEDLTGVGREKLIGRKISSKLFYPGTKRPLMADLVLKGDFQRIHSLYKGKELAPSPVISNAYEAKDQLIIKGKAVMIYFLAARLYNPEGEVIGGYSE